MPNAIRRLAGDVASRGTAVLWATQRLEEIRDFASTVTLLDQGVVGFAGPVSALSALAASRRYVLELRNGNHTVSALNDVLAGHGRIERVSSAEYLLAVDSVSTLGKVISCDRGGRCSGRRLPRGTIATRRCVSRDHEPGAGMSAAAVPLSFRVRRFRDEARKLPAFLRRDLLVARQLRAIFVGDIVSLVMQALLFAYIGKLVDTSAMPSYNGQQASYIEFAAIGIAVGAFTQLGLGRAALAIRNEQLVGTLDPMLATPTEVETIQVGSVMFDLVYVPVRTAVFFVLMLAFYGLAYSGTEPAEPRDPASLDSLGVGARDRRGGDGDDVPPGQ